LKQEWRIDDDLSCLADPRAEAWIETRRARRRVSCRAAVPRAGAWIET